MLDSTTNVIMVRAWSIIQHQADKSSLLL